MNHPSVASCVFGIRPLVRLLLVSVAWIATGSVFADEPAASRPTAAGRDGQRYVNLQLPAIGPAGPAGRASAGNRFRALYEIDPYAPGLHTARLTTPQWVGEAGVDAVITIGIDDLGDEERYERFLRPILQRLKAIDGRAPVSIMSNYVDPRSSRLTGWLGEGLSLEVHTAEHPCPLLAGGNFDLARQRYERCVDQLASVPGNHPVAFRMPCCDSQNTLSTRFFAEIFPRRTPEARYLQLDSSVFCILTSNDAETPRDQIVDSDGRDRFKKYVPFEAFSNSIEDYPYPYVIGEGCWEFPCLAPSDWSAQHLRGNAHPETLRDWKAALDIIVRKQGVMNLVLHPYEWSTPQQWVELIDYATAKYGGRVKFLTFRECSQRLNEHLLRGLPLCGGIRHDVSAHDAVKRESAGADAAVEIAAAGRMNHVLVTDLNSDGWMDVLQLTSAVQRARIWQPASRQFEDFTLPPEISRAIAAAGLGDATWQRPVLRAVAGDPAAFVSVQMSSITGDRVATLQCRVDGSGFRDVVFRVEDAATSTVRTPVEKPISKTADGNAAESNSSDLASAVLDIDGDGTSDDVWFSSATSDSESRPFTLPIQRSTGLRFWDIDDDGDLDLLLSNADECGVWLFQDVATGWSTKLFHEQRTAPPSETSSAAGSDSVSSGSNNQPPATAAKSDKSPATDRSPGMDTSPGTGKLSASGRLFPPFVNRDGSHAGAWVFQKQIVWQNEETSSLPHLIARRSFAELLGSNPSAAKSPRAALNAMQPRAGFVVEQVAAEPLVADPVAFNWGFDGRLWVVEMHDYPSGNAPAGNGAAGVNPTGNNSAETIEESRSAGRVRVLSDENGDGIYDRSTLFLDGLSFPNGVLPYRDGVLITAAPDIIFARDTNADDVCDEQQILFTGFAPGNQQHRVNGLEYGLDNWIHLANGDSGGQIESLKTGERLECGGYDIRIRPDTGEMDVTTGQSQFGRRCDNWGNWFGSNNANPGYHFVLDDLYLRRNPNILLRSAARDVPVVGGYAPVYPISRIRARFNDVHTAGRITSACSYMVYRDTLFGAQFANSTFISEPVHNLVHREVLEATGVSFQSQRAADESRSEFLASSDEWFRPTMLRTGPDGALWIADMYREHIEHPEYIPPFVQQQVNLHAGDQLGRIYRVYPSGVSPRAIPALNKWSVNELVSGLTSPSGWQRDHIQQLIIQRATALTDANGRSAFLRKVVPALKKTMRSADDPLARLHALACLDGLDALGDEEIQHALRDQHPDVTTHALRISDRRQRTNALLPGEIARLMAVDHPRLTLQLAYSLGGCDHADAARGLATLLAEHHQNQFLAVAVASSFTAQNRPAIARTITDRTSGVLPVAVLGNLVHDAAQVRDLACLDVLLTAAVATDAAVANVDTHASLRPGEQKPIDRKEPVGEQLVSPAADIATTDENARRYSRFALLADVLAAMSRSGLEPLEVIQEISRPSVPSAGSGKRQPPPPPLITAVKDRLEEAFRTVEIAEAGSAERQLLLPLLGWNPETVQRDLGWLKERLADVRSAEDQSAALDVLLRVGGDETVDAMLSEYRKLRFDLRSRILDHLLSRRRTAEQLLRSLRDGDVAATELNASRRMTFASLLDENDQKQLQEMFNPAGSASRREVIEAYQSAAELPGDNLRGAAVFSRLCAQCHKLGDTGYELGPNLAALTDRSPEALLIAIFDPNRAVESRFATTTVVTRQGQTVSGILTAETGAAITLRGPEGREQTVSRNEIEDLQTAGQSAMPEGLERDLSPQDTADLLAWLTSKQPKPVRKVFGGNEPQVVLPGSDGTIQLSPATCEIYGSTLVLEFRYGNLGYWQSGDDLAVWSVNLDRPARYKMVLDAACPDAAAGENIQVRWSGGSLQHAVQSTGSWDQYAHQTAGEVSLPAGLVRLEFRAARKDLTSPVIDLRNVLLIPTEPK